MHHYVYQIISLTPDENGVLKVYSGLRSCECLPEEDDYMGSGVLIIRAIEKYGRDKFMKLIIAKFDNREAAYECETAWLEKQFKFHGSDWKRFKTFNYNLRLNEGSHDGSMSPETRAKISEAKIGKYCGENHPLFGKQFSDEHKKKISESLKGKPRSEQSVSKQRDTIIGSGNPNFGNVGFKNPNLKGILVGINPESGSSIILNGKKRCNLTRF